MAQTFLTATPEPAAPRDERRKLVLLGLFGAVLAVAFAFILAAQPALPQRSDFFVRWYATTRLLDAGRNVYDPQNGAEIDQILYGRDNDDLRLDFYYPAHLLLITVPLARLPYATAYVIWTAATQLFLIAALLVVISERRWPPTASWATVYLLAVLFAVPTFQHTFWGQFNTLGVVSLALTYAALRRGRFALAGVLAAGLTFKPHPYALTLALLVAWAAARRERRPFLVGLAAVGAALWLAAELIQPGWLPDFLASLGRYVPLPSVIDLLWNPYQLVSAALVLVTAALFLRQAAAPAGDPAFDGWLVLSLAVWSLVMPFVLMFHVLALSVAAVILLAAYRAQRPDRHRPLLLALVAIYVAGWLVFLAGQPLELHVTFAELAYKIALPAALAAAAVPLVWRRRSAPASHLASAPFPAHADSGEPG